MNVFISFCVMLACFLPVHALNLTGCPSGYIKDGDQTSLTCTELLRSNNYTWSITTPSPGGTEMTIGTCWSDYSIPCQHFNVSDTDYNITRSPNALGTDKSSISFVASEADHHNTTIKCSRSDNVSSITCRINVIEVYKLSSCFVVENAQTKISCSYREPSHGMNWSIKYPNGTVSRVAECAPCVNNTCPDCDVNNTDFSVTRDGTSSILQMANGSDVEKDGAQLQCSRSDGVAYAICFIRVFYYKLPQCEDGQLDVSEVEPWTTVRCEGLRKLQNMNWTITDLTGNVSQIAFCDSKKNCTTDSSDVIVSRGNQYSNLTLVGGVREKANLTCIKRDGGSQASCRIRTFYPSETNNVTFGVHSNFTVTGRVYISKVYASDNNITCQWYHTLDNKTVDQPLTSLSLSTFTDTDGLEYQRGHCDMTLSVNSSEITHFFGVLIQPSNDTVQFAGAVTIEKPGQTLTTTCPDYVSEGSDLTCGCSHRTAQHGNPPASISWRDVTDTPSLHIRNVSKDMNGSEFVCTSVWGEGQSEEVYSSHNYTMLVAYGPNMVTVSASGDGNDDLHNVTLTCTYDAAYPSVNFTWSVACVTLTPDSSTCTIDMGMIDVRDVICTAVNTKFPEINANDLYTFVSNDAVTSPPFPLVGVVVGVVAAVLLCIIIIVVVIIVKRRGSRKTHKDSNTRANDDRDVDEEKGSHLSNSKDQVTPSGFEEHINADNVDAVTSLQVLTVRDDQLQGSSKDATKQGQSTEMAHFNKDAKESTIKEKEAKLKMLEMEKQTARENEERNREEKKKEKAREQEEQKRQKAEEKEAKKKQEAQAKEDKKREKEEKMAEKVREEEEKKKEKEREEDAKKKAKAEEEDREDAKKKEKEREEEDKKKEKAKEEEAKREEQAREAEARWKEMVRKEEEEKEKNEAKKKEKEREEEEKQEKENAKEEEEKRKEEENRKAKAREDEDKENKAREEEAKNRQRAAEKDAKQKQEALEKEERKAKTIEDEKRTDNIAMETPEAKARDEEKEGKPHMVTTKPEEKEKKRTETPEEREARKQRKLKRLLEKILQKIMQVFMDRHGYTDTDTDAKMLEKTREREARKRQKAEEREARRKERLANRKETIEAKEEKEARREARKQQQIQEKEARRKERLARKEEEKTETEEEKEARRQARRVKKEARKAREQEKKAREETRKARKQDEKAREHDKNPKDPALKKDQNQDLTNTAKGVLQAGLGGDVGTEKTAKPADTEEFEEHINELYESADTLDDKTKNASPRNNVVSEHDDFEEHINELYESADDLDRPENSSKTKSTKSKSGAPGLAPDDGKYAVDGSIYHELESEEDTSETVTDTDYESIGYDSHIYDSIGELDTTDDSSSDSYADSLDEEIYDYIDDIYESIDDVFDVNSSDVTPDTKTGAKDGPDLPLFLKEKLVSPGTDALLTELKAVLKRAQKEGVAIPRKKQRPKEKAPLSQAQNEEMKSPCSNGGIQGTAAPSLKGVPNRLDLSGDGCFSVKAAKAFLDSHVHMYSQDKWAKKKGKPQEKEWHTEKDPAEKPLKETASGTDKPQDKESSTTEKTEKQAMKVPQSIRQKEDTMKGSVMKKTPPTVPQKPKGGNWKLNGQAQPDAPEELVYTDCLSQSKKADALTALVGKPTSSPADKEVITQEPNPQNKPRRSELYVSVAPLKQKQKAMTKSAKTGDDNTNGRAAGSKTQEGTKTAEPDDVYNELASTRRRNQEADPIYNHLNQ